MKRAVLVLALLGCKKSEMMPAIPGATVDKFVKAMESVCESPKAGPIKPYTDNPIAASDVAIPCTLGPSWGNVDQQDPVLQFVPNMGGWIQLDADGTPNRLVLTVFIKPSQANGFAHVFLGAYGVPLDTFKKVKGGDDYLFHEPDYRIFVHKLRNPSLRNLLLTITIDNQPGDD
jgi:hypothetical protein